jgi:hypothetical protein
MERLFIADRRVVAEYGLSHTEQLTRAPAVEGVFAWTYRRGWCGNRRHKDGDGEARMTLAAGTETVAKPTSVIQSDPEILGGVPVFQGTRVPFRNLIDYRSADTASRSSLTRSRRCRATRSSRLWKWLTKPSPLVRVLLDEPSCRGNSLLI